jgi:cell division septal protein FtsQ
LEQSGKTELEFKKVSPAELARIKQEIRKRAKNDARWLLAIYGIFLVLTLAIFYFIYWLIETS